MSQTKLSHGYKTSKDYGKLFELAKHQRVVCFIEHKDHDDEEGYRLQDVCQTQVFKTEESQSVSVRGIAYISALQMDDISVKEDFISQCENCNLEFIEPNLEVR